MRLVITLAAPEARDGGGRSSDPRSESAGPDAGWDVVMEVPKDTSVAALAMAAAGTAESASSSPTSLSADPDPVQNVQVSPDLACYLDLQQLDPAATVHGAGVVSGDRLGLDAPLPPVNGEWMPAKVGVGWLEVCPNTAPC